MRWLLMCILGISMSVGLSAQAVLTERIYTSVESMPRTPDCPVNRQNMYKTDNCTKAFLNEYFICNVQYPEAAYLAEKEGTVVVRVVVDTFGKLIQPRIMTGVSTEIDVEAMRIIEKLNYEIRPWYPGTQGKKKVKVFMNIPFQFSIKAWEKQKEEERRIHEAIRLDSIQRSKIPLDSLKKK